VARGLRWHVSNRVRPLRRSLGYRLVGALPPADPTPPMPPVDPTPMDGVLGWLASRDAFSVVQIGAYVGDTANDPLYDFLRSTLPGHPASVAVLVEPVREYFDALRDAYGDLPTVRLENVAIAEQEGDRDFYRLAAGVDPTEYGHAEWLRQLGSLRPDRMTDLWDRRGGEELAKDFWHQHSSVEKVHCWTLEQLLAKHGLDQVDLLQVDAEGYDYEILRTIDLSRVRPRFINYERVHMYEDEPACRAKLIDAGYVLFDWGLDTLAVATAVRTDRDQILEAAGLSE
jgi:FkbM family methyltransferase